MRINLCVFDLVMCALSQTSIAYFASSFQTGVYSTSVVLVR